MPEWTAEQKEVIDSRRQSLLVSAAAGSGKTAVLVQRILEKIMDPVSPVDIDRLLVVTFTNAAAASLREKVRVKLEEEAAGNDPERVRYALRQLAMLSSDHIETIDRFCREIVLEHADELGIDPSFRIADDGELKLLQSETVSQIIEESYEDPQEEFREAFRDFALLYAPGRTDEALEDMILDFYEFSMSHEFPRMWRHSCARLYEDGSTRQEWMQDLEDEIRAELSWILDSLRQALSVCRMPLGPYQYAQAMEEHEELVTRLMRCNSMAERSALLQDFPWPRPGSKKRGKNAPAVDETLENYVKDVRNHANRQLKKLVQKYFFAPEDEIEKMRLATARYMDVLITLADRFGERFAAQKETRRIADFSDVAHWALRVLIQVGEDGMPLTDEEGGYLRTRIAEEYEEYFEEIYIDEYQDSNRVQEILLRSIARPGGRFMVGDMKQSIYRFRMADAGIFLEKAQTYSREETAIERRIDLHRNFRSRREVLDVVNLIFRQIMRREVGGVEYTSAQELRPGYSFPDEGTGGACKEPAPCSGTDGGGKDSASDTGTDGGGKNSASGGGMDGSGNISTDCEATGGSHETSIINDMTPELILAQKDDVPGAGGSVQAEAGIVASRIRSMVGKMMIWDKEKKLTRPVEYRDITILLRSAAGWAETFSRILDENGIPNRPDASTGYFDAVEVRTILAYLNVLDNPRQDIPLAASLRSMIGQISDRELAKIRHETGAGPFYDCILEYSLSGRDPQIREKLTAFLRMTSGLRALVKDTPIHILLWRIFDETGYEDRIAAQEGGRQKKAYLELLVDMAMAYEETSYRGLFHFVRYIGKLRKAQKDIGQASDGAGKENLVRIMTMHKSKGLEFPVVFVCGLNKQFNRQDAGGRLVLSERLGAGLDYRDAGSRIRIQNRIRNVISSRVRRDSIGEELRILYVAMTRSEQKLILTGLMKDRQAAVKKALANRAVEQEKLPVGVIEEASGMLDWILACLARHEGEEEFFDGGRWDVPAFSGERNLKLPGKVRILTGEEVVSDQALSRERERRSLEDLVSGDPSRITDPALHERLETMLSKPYAWSGGREHMPGKLSVSEVKHEAYEAELRRLEEEEETASFFEEAPGPLKESRAEGLVLHPEFLSKEGVGGRVGAAAMGSAYHLVLAELDFEKVRTKEQIQVLLETMLKCDKIQKEEAARIDAGKLSAFLSSKLAQRMRKAKAAGLLWREQPFVIQKNAGELRPEWSDEEQILLQGIIDAFFLEEDEVVLVDYKTDRAVPGDEESLVRRYRVQFALYRDALTKLLGKRVKEAWLYSLSLQKAIPVD